MHWIINFSARSFLGLSLWGDYLVFGVAGVLTWALFFSILGRVTNRPVLIGRAWWSSPVVYVFVILLMVLVVDRGSMFWSLEVDLQRTGPTFAGPQTVYLFETLPYNWRVLYLSAVASFLPALWILRRRLKREWAVRHQRCPECLYDISANPTSVCPECGTITGG